MATTTGTNNLFDFVKEKLMDGEIDLDNDSFQVLLLDNTTEPAVATDDYVDVDTNEVTGNGYARQTLTGVDWTTSGGANRQMKFTASNPVWTASGGSIVARWWVLFKNTGNDATSPLICYGLLDDTPADVTTTDGNTLTLNINANGFFTVG